MAERTNCSGCKIVKINYEWNVPVPFLRTFDGHGESICSPLFSSREIPDSKWKLALFDGGTSFGTTITIMAIQYHSPRINIVDADLLKISILNKRGQYHQQQIMPSHPAGCQIAKSECLDCLQTDGSLTFRCKILALVKTLVVPIVNPDIAINCSDGLVTQLEGLFDTMQLSDVIINIDGRQFPAHKNILIARIKPFAAMFEHSTKEKLTNQIKIEDVEADVFQELLRFVYTGRLSTATMESIGVGLFIAADKYLLDDLKIECENYLLCQLSPVNCLEILLNGNLPGSADKLKKEAISFFQRQPEKVMTTDKWKELNQENSPLLCDIQELICSNK
jgi:speckle-type POZ protein